MQAYSMALRIRVLEAAAAGETTGELSERFSVSPAWVRRLRQRHRQTGEVGPASAVRPAPPSWPTATPASMNFLPSPRT